MIKYFELYQFETPVQMSNTSVLRKVAEAVAENIFSSASTDGSQPEEISVTGMNDVLSSMANFSFNHMGLKRLCTALLEKIKGSGLEKISKPMLEEIYFSAVQEISTSSREIDTTFEKITDRLSTPDSDANSDFSISFVKQVLEKLVEMVAPETKASKFFSLCLEKLSQIGGKTISKFSLKVFFISTADQIYGSEGQTDDELIEITKHLSEVAEKIKSSKKKKEAPRFAVDHIVSVVGSTTVNVLDHGSVELIDVMPYVLDSSNSVEYAIASAARVSHGKDSLIKSFEENARLIKYLLNNEHTSPLEQVEFKFRIKCPLFVARQILRHRTANVNEISQRYTEVEDLYYHPSFNSTGVRLQSKSNRQASIPFPEDDPRHSEALNKLKEAEAHLDKTYVLYHELIKLGVAKEVARGFLPTAQYTEFFFKLDLNNLIRFIRLRRASDAQWETQQIALAIEKLIAPVVPTVMEWLDQSQNKVTFTPDELSAIKLATETNSSVKSIYVSGGPTDSSFRQRCAKVGLKCE